MLIVKGPCTLPSLWPGRCFVVEGLVSGSLPDGLDWEDLEGVEDEIVIRPGVLLFSLEGRESAGMKGVVDVAPVRACAGDITKSGVRQVDAPAKR